MSFPGTCRHRTAARHSEGGTASTPVNSVCHNVSTGCWMDSPPRMPQENPMSLQSDGLTFVQSDQVTRTPVRYQNRYGIEIAADLYAPADLDESVKHPALVVGPPYGGVKEQGPG